MLLGEKGRNFKELLDLLDLGERISDHLLAVDDMDLFSGEHLGQHLQLGRVVAKELDHAGDSIWEAISEEEFSASHDDVI